MKAPRVISFVTWRLAQGQHDLGPAERDVVSQVLRHGEDSRYRLFAFVVMDDHVHVLVEPVSAPLDRLVRSWKSSSAHQLQRLHRRTAPVWQTESFDRPITGGEDLRLQAEYIVGNPWKRWPFIRGYAWVWERGDGSEGEREVH
ncbi:MAG TPA: transposase [Vicinamibacterales bacterium]|nr:transposase [Vicinamibacterales bacterium]